MIPNFLLYHILVRLIDRILPSLWCLVVVYVFVVSFTVYKEPAEGVGRTACHSESHITLGRVVCVKRGNWSTVPEWHIYGMI